MTATRVVRAARPRVRLAVSVGLVLAVAGALLGPASPAQARKVYPSNQDVQAAQSKAARVRADVTALATAITSANTTLTSLQTAAEQAAEAYDAAQARLQQAQTAAASAQRAAASAQASLAAARTQLGEFAASSYRSGGDLANLGALLSSNGPGTLLDQASTMDVLATEQADVLARVQSAQVVAQVLSQQSQAALTAVTTATEQVRTAQLAAQQAAANQASQVKALDAREQSLRAQLTKLDAAAVAVAEQRAAGLAAAAAAAARAAALQRDPGGSASPPTGTPVGVSVSTAAEGRAAVAFAKAQLGKWYLWGGTGPDRFDCSGLTMRAWEHAGVSIPRVASWQYAAIGKIPLSQLRPGDLLFFATNLSDWTTIHHVAIYVGNGTMIEAPHTGAQVRYASIWRPDLFGAGRP